MNRVFAGTVILSLAVWVFGQLPKPQLLAMHVLDIGQGDAIYFRLPNKVDVLVDTGPDDRLVGQLGRYLPFGDREIELLIISHNHADHIGGIKALMAQYKVDQIWLNGAVAKSDTYLEMLKTIQTLNIPVRIVKTGERADLGLTHWLVLHPSVDYVGKEPTDQHDATVVLKVSYNQFCTLLTGDLHVGHEQEIIKAAETLKEPLNCPVLKVTHHGSGNGTGIPILEAVKPQVAIISVGAHNRYGHPAEETLARLKAYGVNIFRTDQQGTVTVTSDGTHFWTKSEK